MKELSILYQDDWLIAIDKEAGHLVHPADQPQIEDVVVMKLVRDHIGSHVYPTHRLDRPTCGVLLFAKDKTTARAINRAFERRQVQKNYRAVVIGQPKQASWTCSEPLQKSPDSPVQEARTEFQVLANNSPEFTLLEARPATGRYHQIRKHLLHCGHPIVGDYRYAGIERCEEMNAQLQLAQRMLLQCQKLTFRHPRLERLVSVAAPPDPLFKISS